MVTSDGSGGLVDKVAQAIFKADDEPNTHYGWEKLSITSQRLYLRLAAAAVQVVQDQLAEIHTHGKLANGAEVCDVCTRDWDDVTGNWTPWPCPTMRAVGLSSGAGSPASSVDKPCVSGVLGVGDE